VGPEIVTFGLSVGAFFRWEFNARLAKCWCSHAIARRGDGRDLILYRPAFAALLGGCQRPLK
jgi:hypothetical protein